MTHALTKLTSRYGEALAYATAAHDGQVRKGTSIPYISHPVAVSALVIEHGGSEDQAIAGLLHDVLEDCGLEHAANIDSQFGSGVLRIVEGLTDGVPDSSGRKPPWRERKRRYLTHLAHAPQEIVLVAAADKLHNATAISQDYCEIGDEVFERFTASKAGTVWYYKGLAVTLGERLGEDHRLVRGLSAAVNTWALKASAGGVEGHNRHGI